MNSHNKENERSIPEKVKAVESLKEGGLNV